MLLKLQGGEPLYLQVYRALCRAIEDGRFQPSNRLPGTRTLARDLGVSRTVVLQAFAQLESEGITASSPGSGTFVSDRYSQEYAAAIPLKAARIPRDPPASDLPAPSPWALSAYKEVPLASSPVTTPAGTLDFTDLKIFQDAAGTRQWRHVLLEAMQDRRNLPQDFLGLRELRVALSLELRQERGLQVDPDDILIVAGIQQARDLVTRVLVQPGMVVGIEDPGYRGIRATFRAAGARVVACAVGGAGLDVEQHADELAEAKLIYVMPSQQFPTGTVMSEDLRHRLLNWACQQGAYIIEDDFEPEHRLVSTSSPPLYVLDRRQQVIYVGAFAREFFPALRMAYVIAPPGLRQYLVAAKWVADRGAGFLLQRVLARYLAAGDYQRNLRRLFVLLAAKRETLVDSLHQHFGRHATVSGGTASGVLLVHFAELPRDRTNALVSCAADNGVRIASAHVYYDNPPPHVTLLLRYAHVPPGRIDEATRRLAAGFYKLCDELSVGRQRTSTAAGARETRRLSAFAAPA